MICSRSKNKKTHTARVGLYLLFSRVYAFSLYQTISSFLWLSLRIIITKLSLRFFKIRCFLKKKENPLLLKHFVPKLTPFILINTFMFFPEDMSLLAKSFLSSHNLCIRQRIYASSYNLFGRRWALWAHMRPMWFHLGPYGYIMGPI